MKYRTIVGIALAPTKQQSPDANRSEMVHLVDENRPMYALCGYKVREILPFEADLDCVVCYEVDKASCDEGRW